MRDRTAARSYSPIGDEFRRVHQQQRNWGLKRRHAERLRRIAARAELDRVSQSAETLAHDAPPAALDPTSVAQGASVGASGRRTSDAPRSGATSAPGIQTPGALRSQVTIQSSPQNVDPPEPQAARAPGRQVASTPSRQNAGTTQPQAGCAPKRQLASTPPQPDAGPPQPRLLKGQTASTPTRRDAGAAMSQQTTAPPRMEIGAAPPEVISGPNRQLASRPQLQRGNLTQPRIRSASRSRQQASASRRRAAHAPPSKTGTAPASQVHSTPRIPSAEPPQGQAGTAPNGLADQRASASVIEAGSRPSSRPSPKPGLPHATGQGAGPPSGADLQRGPEPGGRGVASDNEFGPEPFNRRRWESCGGPGRKMQAADVRSPGGNPRPGPDSAARSRFRARYAADSGRAPPQAQAPLATGSGRAPPQAQAVLRRATQAALRCGLRRSTTLSPGRSFPCQLKPPGSATYHARIRRNIRASSSQKHRRFSYRSCSGSSRLIPSDSSPQPALPKPTNPHGIESPNPPVR
jgi:hypothetical protein